MLIKEYRVVLPLTLEEYKVGQAFTMNELESGNIEVILDEPFYISQGLWNGKFSSGRHTYRIHHQDRTCPPYLRSIAPEGALTFHEEMWDAYPYRRTVLTNPQYMGEYFYASVETMHAPDRGTQENIHELPQERLAARAVEMIDIARDTVVTEGIERLDFYQTMAQKIEDRDGEDPATFVSRTTGRGPLTEGWMNAANPVMCAYKLVTVDYNFSCLKACNEDFLQRRMRNTFLQFHRRVFCGIDRWHGLVARPLGE